MLKAALVDDEPWAREEFAALLADIPGICLTASYSNALECLKQIGTDRPDVLFLDIQMPQLNGLELAQILQGQDDSPAIVFVTAYDEHALAAFERDAVDYLLKPVEPQRLAHTVGKLQRSQRTVIPEQPLKVIPCGSGESIRLIPVTQAECAFSAAEGVMIVSGEQTLLTPLTLKKLEEKTPLLRCHRQYLVQPEAIQEIQLQENGSARLITLSGHCVPVSRRYLKDLKQTLQLPGSGQGL